MKQEYVLKLYRVIPKYIEALRNEKNGGDKRVYMVADGKEHRPFIGIITVCNGHKYCIPLTSHKDKFEKMRDKIDITRIVINSKVRGAVEFSRMIPVEDEQLRPLDMSDHIHDTKSQTDMKSSRRDILKWCNEHSEDIINKANVLYNTYISGQPFKRRYDCLDFPSLEKICHEYNQKHISQH